MFFILIKFEFRSHSIMWNYLLEIEIFLTGGSTWFSKIICLIRVNIILISGWLSLNSHCILSRIGLIIILFLDFIKWAIKVLISFLLFRIGWGFIILSLFLLIQEICKVIFLGGKIMSVVWIGSPLSIGVWLNGTEMSTKIGSVICICC